MQLVFEFFVVGGGLPPRIAGSIHPPVTTGHGDEVMLNFGLGRGGGGPDTRSLRVLEHPQNSLNNAKLK